MASFGIGATTGAPVQQPQQQQLVGVMHCLEPSKTAITVELRPSSTEQGMLFDILTAGGKFPHVSYETHQIEGFDTEARDWRPVTSVRGVLARRLARVMPRSGNSPAPQQPPMATQQQPLSQAFPIPSASPSSRVQTQPAKQLSPMEKLLQWQAQQQGQEPKGQEQQASQQQRHQQPQQSQQHQPQYLPQQQQPTPHADPFQRLGVSMPQGATPGAAVPFAASPAAAQQRLSSTVTAPAATRPPVDVAAAQVPPPLPQFSDYLKTTPVAQRVPTPLPDFEEGTQPSAPQAGLVPASLPPQAPVANHHLPQTAGLPQLPPLASMPVAAPPSEKKEPSVEQPERFPAVNMTPEFLVKMSVDGGVMELAEFKQRASKLVQDQLDALLDSMIVAGELKVVVMHETKNPSDHFSDPVQCIIGPRTGVPPLWLLLEAVGDKESGTRRSLVRAAVSDYTPEMTDQSWDFAYQQAVLSELIVEKSSGDDPRIVLLRSGKHYLKRFNEILPTEDYRKHDASSVPTDRLSSAYLDAVAVVTHLMSDQGGLVAKDITEVPMVPEAAVQSLLAAKYPFTEPGQRNEALKLALGFKDIAFCGHQSEYDRNRMSHVRLSKKVWAARRDKTRPLAERILEDHSGGLEPNGLLRVIATAEEHLAPHDRTPQLSKLIRTLKMLYPLASEVHMYVTLDVLIAARLIREDTTMGRQKAISVTSAGWKHFQLLRRGEFPIVNFTNQDYVRCVTKRRRPDFHPSDKPSLRLPAIMAKHAGKVAKRASSGSTAKDKEATKATVAQLMQALGEDFVERDAEEMKNGEMDSDPDDSEFDDEEDEDEEDWDDEEEDWEDEEDDFTSDEDDDEYTSEDEHEDDESPPTKAKRREDRSNGNSPMVKPSAAGRSAPIADTPAVSEEMLLDELRNLAVPQKPSLTDALVARLESHPSAKQLTAAAIAAALRRGAIQECSLEVVGNVLGSAGTSITYLVPRDAPSLSSFLSETAALGKPSVLHDVLIGTLLVKYPDVQRCVFMGLIEHSTKRGFLQYHVSGDRRQYRVTDAGRLVADSAATNGVEQL